MSFFKKLFLSNHLPIIVGLLFFALNAEALENAPKKKLVILTSKGGFGHMAACDSLQTTLGQDYDIQIVNPFEKILGKIDFVKTFSFRKFDCEQLYNTLLNNGWMRIFNFNARYIMPRVILNMNKKIERLFSSFLQKANPDLLISVIPVLNLPASTAAYKLNIPYLMITLDYDLTMWRLGIHKIQHDNMIITVADNCTKKNFLSRGLSPKLKQINAIGVPVRKTFLEQYNVKKIKKEWGIPTNKPVVMLLMGGAGSAQTYHYFKKLAQFPKPLHILACMGRNTAIEKKLARVKRKPWISATYIPFTQKIPDLMATSNLLITKPGPGTVTEAMIMKLPVLLDRTVTSLFWEKKVFDLVKRYEIGQEVRKLSSLNKQIEGILFNTAQRTAIKHAFNKIPSYCFDQKIKEIVQKLCSERSKNITQ